MAASLRALVVLLCLLVVAGCAGSDDGEGNDSPSGKRDAGTAENDAREGYFDEGETKALDPLLADYDKASKAYYREADACGAQADRLYKADKHPRQVVACHLRLVDGWRKSVTALRSGIESVDGDFRKACTRQRDSFTAALRQLERALGLVRSDWAFYAAGKGTPPRIEEHQKAVGQLETRFAADEVPKLAKACYTKADREAAGSE